MFQFFNLVFIIILYITDVKCRRLQLSCEQKSAFVDGHNLRRYHVAQGLVPGQPAAANIEYMVWDDELAEKASEWAEKGLFSHNPDRNIASGRWDLIGENVFISNVTAGESDIVIPNIEEALDSWFNEYQNYGFEPFDLGTEKPIGHYTQMVWADSRFVGCGISQRQIDGWRSTLFVCDYAPTGNYFGQVPYQGNLQRGFLRCFRGRCDRGRPYGIYC